MHRAALFIAALSFAFVMACAQAAPPAAPSEPKQPVPATGATAAPAATQPPAPTGTLRIAPDAWVPTMFPWTRGSQNPWGRPYQQVYDTLTRISADGKTDEPLLAASWRNIDPTNWEFTLKDNLKWQDGSPLTAHDVVFSIQLASSAPTMQVPTLLKQPNQARAVDDKTVVITTTGPIATLPRLMSLFEILPKAYWERVGGEAEFSTKPMGSGPFKVVEFRPEEYVKLEAVTTSVRGTPRLKEVIFYNMTDAGVRTSALRSGEMDIIASPTPDARQLLPGAGAQVRQFPNVGAYRFFIAPEQWVGPLADKRVRQAMNFAINKQQMIDVAFGGDGVPLRGQILREGFIGYNPNVEPYAYNPARARQLMAEAGNPQVTFDLKFVPFGAGFADGTQMMQQDLAAIGVRAELRLVDPGVYFQEVNQPQARRGLYVIAGGSGDLDGANDLSGQLSTDPRRYYSNPEFDRLVLQARSEFNMQRREQLLQQAVAIMNDDAPWLLMHGSTWVYGVSDKVIDFDKAWMPNGMWRLDGVSIRR